MSDEPGPKRTDPHPGGLCWAEKTTKTPPFLVSTMRCTLRKGHQGPHNWEWQTRVGKLGD